MRLLVLTSVLMAVLAVPVHAQSSEASTHNGRDVERPTSTVSNTPSAISTNNGRFDAPRPASDAGPASTVERAVPTNNGRSTAASSSPSAPSPSPAVPKAVGDGSVRLSNMGPDGDPRYDAVHPSVVYNSARGEYFVVWTGTDDAGSLVAGEAEIYGVHVSASTGDPVGTVTRISTTGPDGDPAFAAQHPSVAYDPASNAYFVAWQGTATVGEYEVYGRRIDAASLSLGSTLRVSTMGADGDPSVDALTPDVVFNADASEYLVVWQGTEGGESEIYGRRVSTSGTLAGSRIAVSSAGPSGDAAWRAQRPAVAYAGSAGTYFVVWAGTDDASTTVMDEYEIYLQRLDATGAEVGADDQRISTAGTDGDAAIDAFRPDVVVDETVGDAFVTWSSNVVDENGAYETYGQRVDLDTGTEVGTNDVRLSTMGPDGDVSFSGFAAAVSGIPGREYYVLWRGDNTTDGAFEIYGQQVYAEAFKGDEGGADDDVLSGLSLSSADHGAVTPSVASDGSGAYLAVWSGDTTVDVFVEGEHEIFGKVVTPSPALPVELAAFQARARTDAIDLAWETLSETNNAAFEVQRRGAASTAGWTPLGRVAGAGTTTKAQTYTFTDDALPYTGERFVYRLRQIDTDGTTSFSDEIPVDRSAVTRLELLGTFPNPARTHATVRFAVPDAVAQASDVRVRLYDLLGRSVRDVAADVTGGRVERRLDLNGVAPGTYFLRLTAGAQTRTQKLTVVR